MRAAKSRAKSSAKAEPSTTTTATVVPHLPAPEAIDHVPWPYFAVSAAERRRMVTREQPQTVTLGALSATTPVVATPAPPAPSMTVPQAIRRATTALRPRVSSSSTAAPPATRALPGTQRPTLQPARPPKRAGPVPVTAPVPVVPTGPVAGGPAIQALKPRRAAGPLVPPAAAGGSASARAATVAAAGTQPQPHPSATLRLPSVPDASRLASWAIALGLLGILCGFVTGVPAVVCGHLALRRLARARGALALRRRAQWAIALGYATTLFWTAYLLLSMVR